MFTLTCTLICDISSNWKSSMRTLRPTVTYCTGLSLHAICQQCVGWRGFNSFSGPARLNTQLYAL